jgi:hypothetical protein
LNYRLKEFQVEMPFTETFARRSIASLKNPVSRWTDEQKEQLRAQICTNARSSDNNIATALSRSRREQMGDEYSCPLHTKPDDPHRPITFQIDVHRQRTESHTDSEGTLILVFGRIDNRS